MYSKEDRELETQEMLKDGVRPVIGSLFLDANEFMAFAVRGLTLEMSKDALNDLSETEIRVLLDTLNIFGNAAVLALRIIGGTLQKLGLEEYISEIAEDVRSELEQTIGEDEQ